MERVITRNDLGMIYLAFIVTRIFEHIRQDPKSLFVLCRVVMFRRKMASARQICNEFLNAYISAVILIWYINVS